MSELRRAVVVGVNSYQQPENLPKLQGAENDAQEIWDRLTDPEIGGFDKDKSHLLKGPNATSAKIKQALSEVFYTTEQSEIGLFYFSGHGHELDCYSEGYICPHDMLYEHPIVNGISMSELKKIISRSAGEERVRCPISILDCCYSGISTMAAKGNQNVEESYYKRIDVAEEKGVVFIASSGNDQESTEIAQAHICDGICHSHGALTYYLLKGLDGEAPSANARISIEDLFKYARDQLKTKRSQRAEISVNQSTGIDQIYLARISQGTRGQILNKILELKAKYKENNPSSVISKAVPNVLYILKYDKSHQEGIEYKQRIEADIKKFGDPYNWFCNNFNEINGELENAARKLQAILIDKPYKADFDTLASLDSDTRNLLTNVYLASMGQLTLDAFIKFSRPYDKATLRTSEKEMSL
jgi:uncharacterized caspase-like protein